MELMELPQPQGVTVAMAVTVSHPLSQVLMVVKVAPEATVGVTATVAPEATEVAVLQEQTL